MRPVHAMQALVPLGPTVQNFGSSVAEVVTRSSTKSGKENRTIKDHSRGQEAATSTPKANVSKGKMCDTSARSSRLKKSYQYTLLALALVVVLGICSVPSILYFTLQVGAL